MWEGVGMSRNKEGLQAAQEKISKLREEFWQNVRVPGEKNFRNQELEKAGRVADFLEQGELMARDALNRDESCGGHFREDHQTPEGEAIRDDENFSHVSAWEMESQSGHSIKWKENREQLKFENVKLATRSYK